MKCPKCNVDLKAQNDRGVQVESCPKCLGMWLTPSELDQLENEAFSNEDNKGSLGVTNYETEFKCPVCSASLKEFDYRFFDVPIECCPDHGYWLDKDEDNQILEIMRGEEARIERKFGTEDSWVKYINHMRSPSFFNKVKDLFRR
jgi:Zn-finger nucleic acid-binding protein